MSKPSLPNTPENSGPDLGPHYEAIIDALVKSGRYPNKMEVLKDGVRFIEQDELERKIWLADVRKKVEEARRDGRTKPAEEVFDRLEAKYQALADKQN